jgi:hypothetical protein
MSESFLSSSIEMQPIFSEVAVLYAMESSSLKGFLHSAATIQDTVHYIFS